MSPLNFTGTGPNPRRAKKKLKLFSAIAVSAGVLAISPTLASIINFNSGAALEFGQGLVETVACSGATALTITPSSTFINIGGGGDHYLSSLTVSNIPSDCYGKKFRIRAFGSTDTPIAIFNSTSSIANVIYNAGTFILGTGGTGMSISSGSGTFTITFTTPVALSSTVEKIAIESSTASCAEGSTCLVGDTGPGGGKVFYVDAAGFNCGADFSATGSPNSGKCYYLEAALSGWANSGTPANDPTKLWAISANQSVDVSDITNESSPNNTTGIGLGYKNSLAIVAQGNDATTAAGAARAYAGGGKGDWYLPTTAELNQMCKWERGVAWTSIATVCTGGAINTGLGAAGFVSGSYWSSSEASSGQAWLYYLNGQYSEGKSTATYVRPVRAF